MTSIAIRGGVAVLAGILIGTPAIGQTPPPARSTAPDPNEIVCEKQEVIGSRLQTKRVCRTRAEWADARLQDRQDLDRRQTQRGTVKGY